MDYAKFAIILWIVSSLMIAVLCRKPFANMFGVSQKEMLRFGLRAYLFLACMAGAGISIGITLIIKSLF